jgi:regulator of G-protein signaling
MGDEWYLFVQMEGLVREMQDPETGVPVRSQKLFLTSIPSAFSGKWRRFSLSRTSHAQSSHSVNLYLN